MEDRNMRLITAYFDKTINDDGLAELKEWLESSPDHQDIFSDTIKILSASKTYFAAPDQQANNWARIQAHIAATQGAAVQGEGNSDSTAEPQSKLKTEATAAHKLTAPVHAKRAQLKNWFAAAAVVLITSVSGLIGYPYFPSQPVPVKEYAQFSNPNGSHSVITLPDSSIIHLGAGSSIRYEKSFTAAKREVYLEGEAFFDVKHQTKRPFIVNSGKIATVVLGTSFNVKAFRAKHRVAVTVKTGKVGIVSSLHGKSALISYLLPDQQLEINTKTGLVNSGKANAAAVSGWTENNFVYYNTSLKDIAESLERHYAVSFVFEEAETARIKLTAKFNNLPLSEATGNLAQLSGLYFSRNGNTITVSAHQQKRRKGMK